MKYREVVVCGVQVFSQQWGMAPGQIGCTAHLRKLQREDNGIWPSTLKVIAEGRSHSSNHILVTENLAQPFALCARCGAGTCDGQVGIITLIGAAPNGY